MHESLGAGAHLCVFNKPVDSPTQYSWRITSPGFTVGPTSWLTGGLPYLLTAVLIYNDNNRDCYFRAFITRYGQHCAAWGRNPQPAGQIPTRPVFMKDVVLERSPAHQFMYRLLLQGRDPRVSEVKDIYSLAF